MTNATQYSTDNYEEVDVNTVPYNRTGKLNEIADKKIKIRAKLVQQEEEGKKFYLLEAANASFRLASSNDGVELILKMLIDNNYWFEGGVIMTEREEYASRMKSKIAGTLEIQFAITATRSLSAARRSPKFSDHHKQEGAAFACAFFV